MPHKTKLNSYYQASVQLTEPDALGAVGQSLSNTLIVLVDGAGAPTGQTLWSGASGSTPGQTSGSGYAPITVTGAGIALTRAAHSGKRILLQPGATLADMQLSDWDTIGDVYIVNLTGADITFKLSGTSPFPNGLTELPSDTAATGFLVPANHEVFVAVNPASDVQVRLTSASVTQDELNAVSTVLADKLPGRVIAAKPDTDLPATYSVGVTLFLIGSNAATGWPVGFATIVTTRATTARTVQQLFSFSTDKTYTRIENAGAWGGWEVTARQSDIVDTLSSTATDKMLSANQGRELQVTKLPISDSKRLFKAQVDRLNLVVGTIYYKLGVVPGSAGQLVVSGALTGHTQSEGRGLVNVMINKRDNFRVSGYAQGVTSNCDIVVYEEPGEMLNVYVKTGQFSVVDVDLTATADATINWDSVGTPTLPAGTLVFTLSTDSGALLKADAGGEFTIDGNIVATRADVNFHSIANNVAQNTTSVGGQSIFSFPFTTIGGTLQIAGKFGCFLSSVGENLFVLNIDGSASHTVAMFFNSTGVHTPMPFAFIVTGLSAGAHTLSLINPGGGVQTDFNDKVDITAVEVRT